MSYRMQRFSAPVFILLIWSLVLRAVGQNPAKFGKPYEAADQEQVVSYWTIDAGWHSELQLRNNMAGANLVVTPVLRSASGEEATLPAITIQPNEVKGVDIRSAIETHAPGFSGTYGSVSLRFHSLSFHNLYAAMMVHDTGHPIAFHIDGIGHIDTFEGASREGIWWLPSETTKDILILTNQGSTPLDLELSLYDATGRESKQQLNLGPRQTGRYAIRDFVRASGLTGTYGGLRIKAATNAGALDTLHAVYDEGAGFSALLKMFDHDPNAKVQERDFARTAVWTLRAPMLALSNPDPALNFPDGTVLQPQLFVRNTTSRPLTAHLKFNWRKENTTGKSVGPTLALAPYETRRFDVAALQDGSVLPKDAYWTSVTLTTNAQPDEVLAVAASYDQSLRYGAQTPFSDQLSYKWEGGEWQYDAMHDSIITAGNGGSKSTRAAFTIFYEEGKQKYELEQELQPDEQMWIDVGKLIRDRMPDKAGRLLPQNLESGSYQFRDLGSTAVGSLFEGKVIYDQTFGHVSYGCAACCASRGIELIYDPFGVPIGFQATNGVQSLDDCENAWISVDQDFYNWSTASHAIATTTTAGVHTGVSIGSTTSSTYGYVVHTNGRNGCYEIQEAPSGPTNVLNVAINTADIVADQISVTLSGPSTARGTLTVQLVGPSTTTLAQVQNAAPGNQTFHFGRTSLAIGDYTSVTATWAPTTGQHSVNTSKAVGFYVLGSVHHTQYNSPYESACSGSPAAAHITQSNCSNEATTLKTDFMGQVNLNGSGFAIDWGGLQVESYCLSNGPKPYPPAGSTFRSHDPAGSCNGQTGALNSSTVAIGSDSILQCNDQILILNSTGGNLSTKTVTDSCPGCSGAHIDDYSTAEACSSNAVGDYGTFTTIRLH